MTTIIYKNGVLAADRRSSAKQTRVSCMKCGSDHTGREVSKIFVPPRDGARFRNEPIRAFASAGKATWCDAMRNAVRRGDDIESASRFLWDAFKRSEDNTAGVTATFGTAVIVTSEKVWIYRPGRGPTHNEVAVSYPLDTKEVLTVGSGGPYAHMAVLVLGHGPVTAVAIAGCHDDCTGQTVNWVRVGSREIKESVFNFPTTYRIYD